MALDFLSRGSGKTISVDTETTGLDIYSGADYAMGVSVTYLDKGKKATEYFAFRHQGAGNLGDEVRLALKELIESAPTIVFHNAKFDIVSLESLDINVFGKDWYCTMMMCHLINENWPRAKTLDACTKHYLGEESGKKKSIELDAWIKAFGWHTVPANLMYEYARTDSEITFDLARKIWGQFNREVGNEEFWPAKRKVIEIFARMQQRGVRVDTELCDKMVDEALQQLDDAKHMLDELNPASQKDMAELFINRLGYPVVKATPAGKPSFDKQAMAVYEQLLERDGSNLAEHVLAYRGWSKSKSAFYEAYLKHLSSDGRLRPSYVHHKDEDDGGTVTGRVSCREPNLQQIPRVSKQPWNGEVKKAFIGSEGYSLWEADYSQLELRLATAYAGEERLKQIFNYDRDIFTEMSLQLGMSRNDTKTFVYSTQYGAGIKRISTVFKISESKARAIRENYFFSYPGFKALADKCAMAANARGRVQIWSGRKRHFRYPADEAHKAMNSVIQGGAADIVERTMIRLWEQVDQSSNGECRMLLQVHDSVVFEIKNGTETKYLNRIKQVMEAVEPDFGVKFAVDVHKWGE